MSSKIYALELLKRAELSGYTVRIEDADGENAGTPGSARSAWNVIRSLDGYADAHFYRDGKRLGWARLMVPGPNTCAPDETIADHSAVGLIAELADAILEELG